MRTKEEIMKDKKQWMQGTITKPLSGQDIIAYGIIAIENSLQNLTEVFIDIRDILHDMQQNNELKAK